MRHGDPIPPEDQRPQMNHLHDARALRLWDMGQGTQEIADRLGVTEASVYNRLPMIRIERKRISLV
jgi:hypothetical protein